MNFSPVKHEHPGAGAATLAAAQWLSGPMLALPALRIARPIGR